MMDESCGVRSGLLNGRGSKRYQGISGILVLDKIYPTLTEWRPFRSSRSASITFLCMIDWLMRNKMNWFRSESITWKLRRIIIGSLGLCRWGETQM
ncbi:hypothetical protein TNCT_219621 [Trichonephila clavata]|uniref:Uncharacterized protein n=1 Tax=Trichonephila clavata TaxID=2740835 RepID=A0A8X6H848_TRICU|nr:hypothetical protein TNCT_219621 [Trichonephila clavata]